MAQLEGYEGIVSIKKAQQKLGYKPQWSCATKSKGTTATTGRASRPRPYRPAAFDLGRLSAAS
jgi:hypothetical protein